MDIPQFVKSEVEELSRAKAGATVVLVIGVMLGAGGGWWLASTIYSERVAVLTERLKGQPPQEAQQQTPSGPQIKAPFIRGWGVPGTGQCGALIEGSALLDFRTNYKFAVVCGLTNDSVDKFEDEKITVSPAFTIREGQIVIRFGYRAGMGAALNDMVKAATPPGTKPGTTVIIPVNTWYEYLLLPKDVRPEDIRKLSDVKRLGGFVISQGIAGAKS